MGAKLVKISDICKRLRKNFNFFFKKIFWILS
nr:MAG TPA: hypothetical protein [Crassvirales sp.]